VQQVIYIELNQLTVMVRAWLHQWRWQNEKYKSINIYRINVRS